MEPYKLDVEDLIEARGKSRKFLLRVGHLYKSRLAQALLKKDRIGPGGETHAVCT